MFCYFKYCISLKFDHVTPKAFAKVTPKAFANFSPGLERSDNPGIRTNSSLNPEGVRQPPNPFRVWLRFKLCPRVLAMLEPWAEISERLWRIHPNLTEAVFYFSAAGAR